MYNLEVKTFFFFWYRRIRYLHSSVLIIFALLNKKKLMFVEGTNYYADSRPSFVSTTKNNNIKQNFDVSYTVVIAASVQRTRYYITVDEVY